MLLRITSLLLVACLATPGRLMRTFIRGEWWRPTTSWPVRRGSRSWSRVVDAAVATGFALSVLRPASSGIGGGGFMLIWNRELQRAICIDYRERAPAKATPEMYADPQDPKSQVPELSYHGPLAIAVPGQVAGLCYAHEKYGKLRLERSLAPAIRLATEGFAADQHEVETQAEVLRDMTDVLVLKTEVSRLIRSLLARRPAVETGGQDPLTPGRCAAIDCRSGAKAFYQGEVARAIVAASEANGKKWLTLEDLTAFQPTERKALSGRFDKYDSITMPPPSSGGIALIEALNIVQEVEAQPFRIEDRGQYPAGPGDAACVTPSEACLRRSRRVPRRPRLRAGPRRSPDQPGVCEIPGKKSSNWISHSPPRPTAGTCRRRIRERPIFQSWMPGATPWRAPRPLTQHMEAGSWNQSLASF